MTIDLTRSNIGKRIVEHKQQGWEKAEYGSRLLKDLSRDLKLHHGKGFSRSNLQYVRLLYIKYPNCQTLSGNLTWSHYSEHLSISDDNPPIGIVLACDKDEILVDYATGSISNQLFVSKYQLFIPDKKMLENELRLLLARENIVVNNKSGKKIQKQKNTDSIVIKKKSK
jgi:DUF1016 N-terminal domain/YhcG PDDEXK nuclease domain